jgi:hypothetical protein
VRFEILRVTNVKMAVFWDVALVEAVNFFET